MNKILTLLIVISGLTSSALPQSEPSKFDPEEVVRKIRNRELERKKEAFQKELSGISEEIKSTETGADTLQNTIDATVELAGQSTDYLTALTAQKGDLEKVLELTGLRIEAEKLKVEGLASLKEAQVLLVESMIAQITFNKERENVARAELRILDLPVTEETSAPDTKDEIQAATTQLNEAKAKLELAKGAFTTSDTKANAAMKAATDKLELADIAALKAKRRAIDLGLDPSQNPEVKELKSSGINSSPSAE